MWLTRLRVFSVLVSLLVVPCILQASPVTIDFETLADSTSVTPLCQ
jgi:hypothetical protein